MKVKYFDNRFYSGFLMGIGLMLIFSFADNYIISAGYSMIVIGIVGIILTYISSRKEKKK